jgi:hypothetical protein
MSNETHLIKFTTAVPGYGVGEIVGFSKEWADAYVAAGRGDFIGMAKPRNKRGDGSSTAAIAKPFGEIEMRAILQENSQMKKLIEELSSKVDALADKKNAKG